MKNLVGLVAIIFLLTACGPGALPFDKQEIQGKGYIFAINNPYPTFTEKTFGMSLAQAAANSIVAAPYRNYSDTAAAVENPKQTTLDKLSPIEPIATAILQSLEQHFTWRKVTENPDYRVIVSNNGWGIRHHPLKVSTYSIFYSVNVAIEETKALPENKEKKRSALFSCHYATDSNYYYDEVFKNKAAAVQKAMAEAIPYCVADLEKQILAKANKK